MSQAFTSDAHDLLLVVERASGEGSLRVILFKHRPHQRLAEAVLPVLPLRRLEKESVGKLRDYVDRPVTHEYLRDLGCELAEWLFPDEIRTAILAEAQQTPASEFRLRLRVSARDPRSAALPWEFLHLDLSEVGMNYGSFAVLHPSISLVRQVEASPREEPLLRGGVSTVKVLLAWADPASANHPAIPGLERELESIRTALQPHAGLHVELQELRYATRHGLAKAIHTFAPHILHFTGHGDQRLGGGVLILNGGDAYAEAVLDGAELASWLRGSPVRLVTLSACYSASGSNSVAAALAEAGIAAVIGMQLPQRPAAAIPFARALYGALLQPSSVEDAVWQARQAVQGHGPDWGIPALFLSAPNSKIFPPLGSETPVSLPPIPFTVEILQNPQFVGHSELLAQLHDALTRSSNCHVTLAGQGGCGKSQLAAEYAHSRRSEFPGGIFWVNAESFHTMQQGLAGLRRYFGVPDTGSEREQMERVVDGMHGMQERALLILDNLTEATGRPRFPTTGACAVLVTARPEVASPSGFQLLKIPPLDDRSAMRLLSASRRGVADEELTALRAITELLGNLPLALVLVRHRIERLRLSFADALRQLEAPEGRLVWLERARKQFFSSTGHDGNIYRAIELSYQPLEASARCILSAATCFSGLRINPALLHKACPLLDEENFQETVADLEGLSLLTREADGRLTIHELIRVFAWLQMDDTEQTETARTTAALLTEQLRAANEELEWQEVRQEISHCYAAVRRCLEKKLRASRQALLREIGCYHFRQRNLMPAFGHLRDSLMLAEELYGRRHIEVAEVLRWKAFTEEALERSRLARSGMEEALSIAQEVLPVDDPKLAEFHNGMGYVLKWAGELDAAEWQYGRALEIAEQSRDGKPATVAMCLNNLGAVHEARRDLEGALARYREALKIDREVFPASHYKLAIRMNNLGWVLTRLMEPDEAVEWHTQALKIVERVFDEHHLHAGMTRYYRAEALRVQGSRREACEEYKQSLAILAPIRGERAQICELIATKLKELEGDSDSTDD